MNNQVFKSIKNETRHLTDCVSLIEKSLNRLQTEYHIKTIDIETVILMLELIKLSIGKLNITVETYQDKDE